MNTSTKEMFRAVFSDLMTQAPYQPATNYWRAIEIGQIIQRGIPQGRGLDLGCGDGHLMGIILRHVGARELIGVDVDQDETAMASMRNLYSNVVTAAAHQLPFPDRCFDYAFSNSVLEHIAAIDETLREVARVLRPDARFLFTVPGPEFHKCLSGSWFQKRDIYLRRLDARCAHLRYWNDAEWREHLRLAGFTVAHVDGYLAEMQVQRWESIARFTSGIVYNLLKGRKQPIAIQRQLGLRSTKVRLPRIIASATSRVLSAGVSADGHRFGCLLIEAERNAQSQP